MHIKKIYLNFLFCLSFPQETKLNRTVHKSHNFRNKYLKQTKTDNNVAIIIPYRDRAKNLELFLRYMHEFLRGKKINYGIYLVEPVGDLLFNRALLINIGFIESLKDNFNWNCFIFHDIVCLR